MNDVEIFRITGMIIWLIFLSSAVLVVVAAGIIAPIVAYRRVSKFLWTWRVGAEVAKHGFTADDILWIYRVPSMKCSCKVEDFLEYARRVKERGDSRTALKEKDIQE